MVRHRSVRASRRCARNPTRCHNTRYSIWKNNDDRWNEFDANIPWFERIEFPHRCCCRRRSYNTHVNDSFDWCSWNQENWNSWQQLPVGRRPILPLLSPPVSTVQQTVCSQLSGHRMVQVGHPLISVPSWAVLYPWRYCCLGVCVHLMIWNFSLSLLRVLFCLFSSFWLCPQLDSHGTFFVVVVVLYCCARVKRPTQSGVTHAERPVLYILLGYQEDQTENFSWRRMDRSSAW